MKLSKFIAKMKRFDRNAEVIFDRQEPIGFATDLVMPRRRWFGQSKRNSQRESFNHRAPVGSEIHQALS